jgi:hypothetical protein
MKILSINGLRFSCKHKIVKRIREQYTLDRTVYTDTDEYNRPINWSIGTDGDICFVHTACQPFNEPDEFNRPTGEHPETLVAKDLVFNESFLDFLTNADYKFLVLVGASWCVDNIFDFETQAPSTSTSAYKAILNTKDVETIIFTQTWDNYKKCALRYLVLDNIPMQNLDVEFEDDFYDSFEFEDRQLDKPRYDWFVPQIDDSIHTVINEDELSEDEIYNLLIAKLQ